MVYVTQRWTTLLVEARQCLLFDVQSAHSCRGFRSGGSCRLMGVVCQVGDARWNEYFPKYAGDMKVLPPPPPPPPRSSACSRRCVALCPNVPLVTSD